MWKTLPIRCANGSLCDCIAGRLLYVVLVWVFVSTATVRGKEGDRHWFQPFSWQEPQVENPINSPPPGKITQAWNPLKWSNQPNATSAPAEKQPAVVQQAAATDRPLHQAPTKQTVTAVGPTSSNSVLLNSDSSVVATDQQTQPIAYQQPAIEWPAEEAQDQQDNGQGTNPFGWTNVGPTVPQTVHPGDNSSLVERSQEPWNWSNEPLGKEKPGEVMPPQEPSLSSAMLDALKWSDQPNNNPDSAQQRVAQGLPPKDATEEELIAWEKENLPWIRPFYWANNDPELGPRYEIIAPDATPSPTNVPMIARPFLWENRQASYQVNPLPPGSTQTYPTTQAAAFMQPGETLPQPPESSELQSLLDDPFGEQPEEIAEGEGIDEEKKGGLAEAESLGEAPVDNSLQFLRADTVLLDPGEFQYEYGIAYSKFDISLPIVINTINGNLVELADFHIRELRVPLEIRYGLARRLQLFVNVPFGWSNTEFSFPGFEDFENDGGLSDIIFGGSFLLRDNDPCNKPDAILTLSSVAPTGNEPFTPAGLSPSSPSLGSGVWSLAANLLFIQNYDPVVVFYGFGTRQSFEGELDTRDFQPGGEYNYQFGVGFAVNRQITFSTRFNGAYVSDTKLDGNRLPGTTQEPMILSLAMTVSKNKKLIEPFVDFGLTDDSTDARFGITWTH